MIAFRGFWAGGVARALSGHRRAAPTFVWTATAKAILKKTARAKQTLETVRAGTKC